MLRDKTRSLLKTMLTVKRNSSKMQLDHNSITGLIITIFSGFFANVTQSKVMFIVTLIAAVTTIIYNIIKIRKEIKH